MTEFKKPLPQPNPVTLPFWEAAKQHELKMQRCKGCREYIFYPRGMCPDCFSTDMEWVRVSGKGKVYSYTIARVPTHPGLAAEVPYVIAMVELAEGPRIMTNIVGCSPEAVRVDMPVKVFFDDITAEISLVKFCPD